MNPENLIKIIQDLVADCTRLKDKFVDEKNLEIDYVCIFSQNETEYDLLHRASESLGKVVGQTPTGDVFALPSSIAIAGKPKVLKIRKPDPSKPQRGDTDFVTDYENFKKEYLNKSGFTLIKRAHFEMIELRDDTFDVLAYFSNMPPSQLLNSSQGLT